MGIKSIAASGGYQQDRTNCAGICIKARERALVYRHVHQAGAYHCLSIPVYFCPAGRLWHNRSADTPSNQQSKHVDVHVAFSSESPIYCNGADIAVTSNIRVPHTIPIPTTDKPGCPHVSKCKGECRRNSPECPELSSPRCLEECDARLKFVTASPLTPLGMLSTYSAILGACSREEVALKDDRLEILFVRLYTIS